mmetsp:Transcript_20706/g.69211  ORF Transcript_20706/g.69211 Transcript_20706/m.69211 type:complete len:402 (-) Transcript_20706:1047-2252(-)
MVDALAPRLMIGRLDPHVEVKERNARGELLVHGGNELEVHNLVTEVQVSSGEDVAEHLSNPLDAVDGETIVVPLYRPLVGPLPVLSDCFCVSEPQGSQSCKVVLVDNNRNSDRIIMFADALAIMFRDLHLDAVLVFEAVISLSGNRSSLINLNVHFVNIGAIWVDYYDDVFFHLCCLQPVSDGKRLVISNVTVYPVVVLRSDVRWDLLHKMIAYRMWIPICWPSATHGEQAGDLSGLSNLLVPEDVVSGLPLKILLALDIENCVIGRLGVGVFVAARANPRRTVSSSSTIRREPVDVIVEEQKLHLLLEAGQVVTVELVAAVLEVFSIAFLRPCGQEDLTFVEVPEPATGALKRRGLASHFTRVSHLTLEKRDPSVLKIIEQGRGDLFAVNIELNAIGDPS